MRLKQKLIKAVIKSLLFLYLVGIKILSIRKQNIPKGGKKSFVLTGTFHSMNWIQSHIIPISRSKNCDHIFLISVSTYPDIENVTFLTPPNWLINTLGKVPARLVYFIFSVVRLKPDYVGGFHLLFNSMIAQFAAKLVRAKSLYFCVGGPAEVLGGGINSENRLLGSFREQDMKLERTLLKVVKEFDLIVTMGTSAKKYFENNGVSSTIEVISGGIDSSKFQGEDSDIHYDFIFVGRLAEIKRIDIILNAIERNKQKGHNYSVAIVGDGEKRAELEELSKALGLQENVHFLGKRDDIENWFKRSKVFLLTSDSEGLSLALIEAMMCGLPAIVSNVGDLADIVEDASNGYLVDSRDPEEFANKMMEILNNENKYREFSIKATESAKRFTIQNTINKWDKVLA
jgi:glycosyltransferase involved in cell wall biosynthesis